MNMSHRMIDTITIASQTGVNSDGDPQFGSQTVVKARVQKGSNREAQDILHDFTIYTNSLIFETDRIWLSGDDTANNDAARKPVAVYITHGLDGGYTLFRVLL